MTNIKTKLGYVGLAGLLAFNTACDDEKMGCALELRLEAGKSNQYYILRDCDMDGGLDETILVEEKAGGVDGLIYLGDSKGEYTDKFKHALLGYLTRTTSYKCEEK